MYQHTTAAAGRISRTQALIGAATSMLGLLWMLWRGAGRGSLGAPNTALASTWDAGILHVRS